MPFSLKKLLQGVVAEINPFDGGQNFQSVQRGTPAQPAPASTSQAQQPSVFQRAASIVEKAAPGPIKPALDITRSIANEIAQPKVVPKAVDVIKQAPEFALNTAKEAVKAPVNAIASPIEYGIGLALNDPNVQQDAIRRNPIARSGTDYANAAVDVQQGRNPSSNLLKGTGEAGNLIASSLPLAGFGGRQAGETAVRAAVRSGAQNAALGGAIGGAQGAQTGNLSDALKSAGLGAAMGGALGAGGELAAPAVKTIATSPELNNEVGAVGRNIDKAATQPPVTTKLIQPKAVDNKFTQSVQKSPEVSPEVQSTVSGQHIVRSTKQLADNSQELLNSQGIDRATQQVHTALAVPDGKITDQDIANGIAVAKANDAAGNVDAATSIYDALSDHLVKAGQTVQAASLLLRRSPEGLVMAGRKALNKAGVEITPELKAAMEAAKQKVASFPEGSAERDYAVAEFQRLIDKSLPSKATDKALGIWKAGLLSGVKTQGGNFLSNATFGVLKKASDIPATGIDKALSLVTGERTKTLTGKGILSGAKEGGQKGLNTLKTGIDERNIGQDKYQLKELNFKNPVLNKYVNGIFRSMSAADQPFYYGALRNNLNDIAGAVAKNQGLKGAEAKSFIKDFIANPPDQAFQAATDAAEKAVLSQDNALSRGITKAVRAIPGGQVVVPFTKVPTNFLIRTLDYTPVGAVKTAIKQIRKGRLDQRELSEALGEATTGSAVVFLGTELAGSGLLSGDYPNDPKEQQRWKAEGITPNSVKIGNTWYSLNYLGPLGLLLGAGKNMHDAVIEGNNAAIQAAAGLGKGLTQQSFLQGLSGFANALNDPGRYGANLINSQVASTVPSFMNDVANALDPMQRQTNSAIERAASRIPGVRNSLNPKIDALGNDLKQPSGSGVRTAVDPTRPSKDLSTNLTKEIDRLKSTGKENFVFPTPDKTIQVGNEKIKLNGDQQYQYNQYQGQQIQQRWNELITSPEYQQLSDADKANALRNSMSDVSAVAKVQMLDSLGKADLAKAAGDKLSNRQYALLTGATISPQEYAVAKTDNSGNKISSTTSPKQAYQNALRSYQKDQTTLSDSKKIQKERELNTLKIKSDYDQDVIDFYNLSNADKSAYFKRDPEKAKQLYDQAKELSGKLAAAGLSSKTVSTSTDSSKKSSGGSKKSGGAKKGKYDYAKQLASTNSTTTKAFEELRSITKKKPTYNRKKVSK